MVNKHPKPDLFDFAWFPSKNKLDKHPDFDTHINDLSILCEKENWEYKFKESRWKHPILRNYIIYTFKKLREENKIAFSDDKKFACFNTGLVTENLEEIFALFSKHKWENSPIPWWFIGFHKGSSRILLNSFGSNTPDVAKYITNPSDIIYDLNCELIIDFDHIIEDNIGRFPPELINHTESIRLVLESAKTLALKRVKRNWKTAIPHYYFEQQKIQLLLPLGMNLADRKHVDLALVVEKVNNVYRGATCLTLDDAYSNARLISKPDDEWLNLT
ncbi:MAG: DUF3825 domain-containing protein [Mariniphaga sp.]